MYKVCILTAGKGTRNKYAHYNKALLLLGVKPAISYIIDKFPEDIEIVIATGYNAELVESFVDFSYPDRTISFVRVRYDGVGVGPGFSLLECSPYLQCPFIYSACDTIVLENIPKPDRNWIGVSTVTEKPPYLTIEEKDGMALRVYDKGDKDATYLASIGLVGVKDYKSFWKGLANPSRLVQGEHQDTSGLNALIPMNTVYFTWFDIGGTEGYENTNRYFNKLVSE